MSDWSQVALGDVAEFRNGLNYTQEARWRGGLPIVGVKDFQARSFVDFTDLEELDPVLADCGDTIIRKNDILFVRSNGNRELIGRSLLVRDEPPRPTTYSGFTIRLRFVDNRCDPNFFAYVLRGPLVRRALTSQGGGTNINNLNQTILARLLVPFPSLAVQHRIASILGAYDDLIEVNRRRIALLEKMTRLLFDEWFVHFRFPGFEGNAMVATPEGPLPKGWRWAALGTLCVEVRDAILPSDVDGATPYVGLEHMPRRSVTLNTWGRADEVKSTKLRFQLGDVLFGKIRPYFHKVAVAPFGGVSSSDAIVIRGVPHRRGLVLCVVSSDPFVAHAVATSNGTKMPRANWSVLTRTPVPIGPDDLMKRFNETVVAWTDLAALLNAATIRLTASRDLLLPRLISGELSLAAAKLQLENAA